LRPPRASCSIANQVRRGAGFLAAGSLVLLIHGCSARVDMPPISPEEAAKQALAEYDKNKDGFLDANELEHCPALKNALKTLDKNKDGRLSADEIAERLTAFQATGVGLL